MKKETKDADSREQWGTNERKVLEQLRPFILG
jgi:hypothetical protein